MFRAGETHILTCRDAFFVALRRRNANFVLTSGDAFCVALRRENNPTEIRLSVSRRRNANFDLPRRIFCGPAQAKRKFDLPRRVLCPGVTTRWTKIATALQRHAKKFSGPTQILTSGVAFFVALRRENRRGQKFAPRPKRLYPYRKNPSVCHTAWGKIRTKPLYSWCFRVFWRMLRVGSQEGIEMQFWIVLGGFRQQKNGQKWGIRDVRALKTRQKPVFWTNFMLKHV